MFAYPICAAELKMPKSNSFVGVHRVTYLVNVFGKSYYLFVVCVFIRVLVPLFCLLLFRFLIFLLVPGQQEQSNTGN